MFEIAESSFQVHSNPLRGFEPHRRFKMSAFSDLLAGKLAEEASENVMRDAIGAAMRSAADRGDSGKGIAKEGLRALFGDRSPVMGLARGLNDFVPKAAYPVIATVGATAIAKFADDLLPGDNRPAVRQARFILKYVAPHLVIGAAEAFGDVTRRIDEHVDAARSDDTTPDQDKKAALDYVVEADAFPDRIFIPARDSDDNILKNPDGTPVVSDRDFVMAQRVWDQTHKPEKKTTGGKGQQQRTETIPATPFPCRLVPLKVAIERLSATGVLKSDIEAIRKLLKKPDSWGAKLSSKAKTVLLALSTTRSKRGPLEQTLAEDLFQDLPGKADVALIEAFAERFESRIQSDGSLSDADYDAAVAYIDDWLGGELTRWSKLQRSCARIWRNRGSLSDENKHRMKFWYRVLVGLAFVAIALFCASFAAMVLGTVLNLSPWLGASLVFFGAWVITVLLFLFRPLQGILNPIAKIFGAEGLWLTSFGFKFTLLIAPFGLLLPLAILCGASLYARFLIVGIPLLAIGSGMAFKAADVPALARMLTIQGAKYGWIGGLLIIGVDWLIRSSAYLKVWAAIVVAWKFIAANQYLSSAILFGLALVLGNLLIVRPIERVKYRNGDSLVVDKKTSWFARLAVVAIAVVLGFLPWLKTENIHTFDPFGPDKPTAADSSHSTNPAPKPVAPDTGVPAQVGRSNGASHNHFGKLDCSALSFEGRRAVGCP